MVSGKSCFFFIQILTKDSVTVVVDAVIYARIYDATMSTINIENARQSTLLLGATTLRTILGTVGLSEILSERERIDKLMQVSYYFVVENALDKLNIVLATMLYRLALNAPIATKVVCFSRLLKCSRSLYGKQCGPRSDCSYKSSLFWVYAVCFYSQFVSNARRLFAADDFSRRHFHMHFFLAL